MGVTSLEKKKPESGIKQLKVLVVSPEADEALLKYIENFEARPAYEQIKGMQHLSFVLLKETIERADEGNFDLLIALVPEQNRFALAYRNISTGRMVLLSNNQLALILSYALAGSYQGLKGIRAGFIGELVDKIFIHFRKEIKSTIVPAAVLIEDLLKDTHEPVLVMGETGEFFLANQHNSLTFITGHIVGLAQKLQLQNLSFYDLLIDIYKSFGFYKEKSYKIAISKPSQKQFAESLFASVRKRKTEDFAGFPMQDITDHQKGIRRNLVSGRVTRVEESKLPIFDITLSNGVNILMTQTIDEKLTISVSMKGNLASKDEFERSSEVYDKRIVAIMERITRGM